MFFLVLPLVVRVVHLRNVCSKTYKSGDGGLNKMDWSGGGWVEWMEGGGDGVCVLVDTLCT